MHAVLVLFQPSPNVGIQNFGMWGMYNLAKACRSIENLLPIAESRTGKPAMVTLKIQPDCSTVHDLTLWANIFVRSHWGCGTDSVPSVFLQVPQIFQRRKSDANKQDFENKLNLTCQAQSTPKTIGIFTKVFCTSGPNLVVLARTGDELLHEQAQNGVNFDFEVKFDLEGHGQSLPKTIGILTKFFYIYGPNLVILAERGDELSRGQAHDWRTDGHTHRQTDAGNDNTRRPKLASGKNYNWKYTQLFKVQLHDTYRFGCYCCHGHTVGRENPKYLK